jgi:hypothetical protein
MVVALSARIIFFHVLVAVFYLSLGVNCSNFITKIFCCSLFDARLNKGLRLCFMTVYCATLPRQSDVDWRYSLSSSKEFWLSF